MVEPRRVRRIVEPSTGAGGMRQWDQDGESAPIRTDHPTVDVKNPAHQVPKAPAGQKPLMGQTAHENDHVRTNECELAVEV